MTDKDKKGKLPGTNKSIKSFLSSEDGKVSKNGLVAGAIVMAIVGMAAEAYGHVNHSNSIFQNPSGWSNGQHVSHASHGSHGSHASHGSHGSHGSW